MNGIYAAEDGQNLTSNNNITHTTTNNITTTQSSSSENNAKYYDYQTDVHAAGEGTPSFTNQQITQAAIDVKKFLEGNKYLPEYITINGIKVNQATFLQLLTTTTLKINNSDNTTTPLITVNQPPAGTETTTPRTLTQTEYLTMAQNIANYIIDNGRAPSTVGTVFGNIKFQSLLYLYSRALNMHETYGALPTFLAVRPWNNIPITDTNKKTITTQDITNTATEVKNFLEYHKYLPEYITINGIVVNQATFLQLLTQTTLKINNNDNTPLNLTNTKTPTTGTETTTPGTLTKNEYLQLAQNIQTFIENNGQAPGTITSSLGNIKFQSALYMYCRVLNNYKDNGVLPQLVTVRPWSTSNIPIRDEFFTIQQITKTAIEVKNFLEGNKYLPEYITVNGVMMNQSQFIYLITTATIHINTGDTSLISLINANKPGTGSETIAGGIILQNEYITLAKNIKNYIENNKKAPSLVSTSLGQMSYQATLYMYCRILNQYNSFKDLPSMVNVKPWKMSNIPIYDTISFTISQITQSAVDVKNFVVGNAYYPELITINGVLVNQAQFLQLLTTATIKLNNKDNTVIYLQNGIVPSSDRNVIAAGTLVLSKYVELAGNINTYFINHDQEGPSKMSSSVGEINFLTLLYTYCRVLSSYQNNALPVSVVLYKPVYITSDNIYDSATDQNRMKTLVSILRNAGADAYGYGIGPDTQNAVLRNSSVQQGALVVDIYGGACAGTIYAMIGSYYQGIKGAREVYSIWISPPAWNITDLPTKATNCGVNFLPRAHDDTFSKYLPDWGYNLKGEATDGLKNPDLFLNSHGFNFLVTIGDLQYMAAKILFEAKS